VLDVHAGADELIVDLTVDAVGRQAIAAAEALVMVGFVDNVKLQFSTRRAQALTRTVRRSACRCHRRCCACSVGPHCV